MILHTTEVNTYPADVIRPQASRSLHGLLKLGANIASIVVLLSHLGTATAEAAEDTAGAEPHGNDMALSVKAGYLGIVVDTTRYISDRVNYRIWVSQSVDGLTDAWTSVGLQSAPYPEYSYHYE